MTQLEMFPEARLRPTVLPYQKHSRTSRKAAERAQPVAPSKRQQILEWLREHGPATDEQIGVGTGIRENTVRPRRGELVTLGLVIDSGLEAETSTGSPAVLWRAT
jgi:predicted ArsR family transcriptional regulator